LPAKDCATAWPQVRVLPGLDQGVVDHAAATELLADNEIKQRYCSV